MSQNVILEKDKTAYFSRLDHLTCEVAKKRDLISAESF